MDVALAGRIEEVDGGLGARGEGVVVAPTTPPPPMQTIATAGEGNPTAVRPSSDPDM